MNNDGTKNGFANEILSNLSDKLTIPIIASGGAGKVQDFIDVFNLEMQMQLWQQVYSISKK